MVIIINVCETRVEIMLTVQIFLLVIFYSQNIGKGSWELEIVCNININLFVVIKG